ncbi:MAG: NusG domain II-containing protein [Lachnospiraceae bacterium]|nr:NusG domain II-containing protein [Lachnospiraceae bacterium]MDE6185309.1 NusG domain II-containing protein [Lachnospiraceae bacterium]
MKNLKKDVILLGGILFAAFVIWLIPVLLHRDAPAVVRIIQDGQEIGTYSVLEEQTIAIPYEEESYNLLLISGGQVSVSDADCPDGLCIRHRAIERSGESIICLPHKLVIQIESKEESDLDAVTY